MQETTKTETSTILEINSKDLAIHLANSLDYVTNNVNTIFNSIYISGEYIAASEGSKMILTKLGPTDSTNYVLVDSKDIAVLATALKALNKVEKRGYKVVIQKQEKSFAAAENTVTFTVLNCYKEVKLSYSAEALDIKAPNYLGCLIPDKKVLGIFKKSSLLKLLSSFKGKNKVVTLNKDSDGVVDFDEATKEVNFYAKDLLTLVKTCNQEGILLYTHEEGERILKSPVFIEQDNMTAAIMPVLKNRD